MQNKSIEEILSVHTQNLMKIPGVIGTAIGELDGKPCIIVMVTVKTENTSIKIPSHIESYSVQIKETGDIRARDSEN